MNFGLAREIYGAEPWCVDQHTYPALTAILEQVRQGITLEIPETKYNSTSVVHLSNENRLISRPYQLNNSDEFTGIGIISINGPITVSGGASSYGMDYVSAMMNRMANDSRIVSFVIVADSGGGSSAAVEIMTDTINEIKQTKPVYGHVKKGGVAASAMYGILSACTEIYAASEMSIVGSVGTMIEFRGKKANSKDKDGTINIRVYAPGSTHKNRWYEEALNNDNYEILTDELLKPVNERFKSLVLKNRPALNGSLYDNGHTVFAKDAVGTFIDGIKSFSEVVDIASNEFYTTGGSNSNNVQSKSNTMTVEELKRDHPATYNSIFKAGASAEKDRTGAWLAHLGTNQETVIGGIVSGEPISMTQTQELLVEAASKNGLKALESDSAAPVRTKESDAAEAAEDANESEEVKNFYATVDNKLKAV